MKLLLGGSGLLGRELQKYVDCQTPSSTQFNIRKFEAPVDLYFGNVDTVIHAAAYTDVPNAEIENSECYKTNVIGTYNLLNLFKNTYFVYISSEYVQNPVNFYSKTKLWGEEMVKSYSSNYLIIRTLFKPRPFPHREAFADQHTTGDYVDVIAPLIVNAILKKEVGTINIGTGRKTMFELARQSVPDIKGISVDDITDVKLPKDYL